MAGDAFYPQSVLRLHFDGANNATTFPDTSPTPKTLTAQGDAKLSTLVPKFGTACLVCDGTGDAATTPDSAAFDMGTGDFTLNLMVNVNTYGGGNDYTLLSKSNASNIGPWALALIYDGIGNRVRFSCYNTANASIVSITHSTYIAAGSYYEIEAGRSSTTFRLWVNGTLAGSTATSSAALKVTTEDVVIGARYTGAIYAQSLNGRIDDLDIIKGAARHTAAYTARTAAFDDFYIPEIPVGRADETDTAFAFVPSTVTAVPVGMAEETDTAFPLVMPISAWLLDAGLPSPAEMVGWSQWGFLEDSGLPNEPSSAMSYIVWGDLIDDSLLGVPEGVGFTDFTQVLAPLQPHRYYMDLVTPSGLVRVPISSWQATLQVDSQCYAGCVIPHSTQWLDILAEATEFIISRLARFLDGSTAEIQLVRSPLQTLQFDRGSTNPTASLSGYSDAFGQTIDPDEMHDRTLQDVRSISTYSSGARLRCSIDWLLRPGQRALYGETSLVVAYMNMYVTMHTATIEAYMDVGERN